MKIDSRKMLLLFAIGFFLNPMVAFSQTEKNIKKKTPPYLIINTPNRQGKNVRQILTGQNGHSISLDSNGDGYMDYWETRKGNLLIKGEHPFRGQFLKMTAEKRIEKGTHVLQFALSPDKRKYRLISSVFKPFTVMNAGDEPAQSIPEASSAPNEKTGSIWKLAPGAQPQMSTAVDSSQEPKSSAKEIFKANTSAAPSQQVKIFSNESSDWDIIDDGASCLKPPESLDKTIESWQDILVAVSDNSYKERKDFVLCNLKKYQKFLFEPNCFAPKFKDSMNDILDGFAEVMISGAPDNRDKDMPTFLSCMNSNGMGVYTARIEEQFFNRIYQSCLALHSALNKEAKCGGTIEEFKARMKQNAENGKEECAPMPIPAGYKDGNKKMFSCDYVPIKKVQGRVETSYGRYYENTKQISLHRTSSEVGAKHKCSASHGYATTIFHELLHSAGLDGQNENLVRNIEDCCGNGRSPDSASCKSMFNTVDTQRIVQSSRALFESNVNLTGYYGARDLTQTQFTTRFGYDTADQMIDRYMLDLHKNAPKDKKAYDTCIKDSGGGSCDQNCRTKCDDDYRERLAKHTEKFWKRECKNHNKTHKAEVDCETIAEQWASVVTDKPQVCKASNLPTAQRSFVDFLLSVAYADNNETTGISKNDCDLFGTLNPVQNGNTTDTPPPLKSIDPGMDTRSTDHGFGEYSDAAKANENGSSATKEQMSQASREPASNQGPVMTDRSPLPPKIAVNGTPSEAEQASTGSSKDFDWSLGSSSDESSDSDFDSSPNYASDSGSSRSERSTRSDNSFTSTWFERVERFMNSQAGVTTAYAGSPTFFSPEKMTSSSKSDSSNAKPNKKAESKSESLDNTVGISPAKNQKSIAQQESKLKALENKKPDGMAPAANSSQSAGNPNPSSIEKPERIPASANSMATPSSAVNTEQNTQRNSGTMTKLDRLATATKLLARDPKKVAQDLKNEPDFLVQLIDMKVQYRDDKGKVHGDTVSPELCFAYNKFSRQIEKGECPKK